jgi:hypothetical protein
MFKYYIPCFHRLLFYYLFASIISAIMFDKLSPKVLQMYY